jgi:hypothetical protein
VPIITASPAKGFGTEIPSALCTGHRIACDIGQLSAQREYQDRRQAAHAINDGYAAKAIRETGAVRAIFLTPLRVM